MSDLAQRPAGVEALSVVNPQMKGGEMIYLPYTSLITHIISYNKMLIIYHKSSRETHLSNIHLNMGKSARAPSPTLYGRRDQHKPPPWKEHISPREVQKSLLPLSYLPTLEVIRFSANWCRFDHTLKKRRKKYVTLHILTRRGLTASLCRRKNLSGADKRNIFSYIYVSIYINIQKN